MLTIAELDLTPPDEYSDLQTYLARNFGIMQDQTEFIRADGTLNYTAGQTFADVSNAINSGDYPLQFLSGQTSFSQDAFVFDTTTEILGGDLFSIKTNNNSRFTMTGRGNMALGTAFPVFSTLINSEFAPQSLPIGIPSPIIKLKVNIDNGLFPLPTGIFGEMHILAGHTSAIPLGFRSEIYQDSNTNLAGGDGFVSFISTSAGSTGTLGTFNHFLALEPTIDGAGGSINGMFIEDQGAPGIVVANGVEILPQTVATTVAGIVLKGDGVGSDQVMGVGKDVSFRFGGVNTELVNLVGSGNFDLDMDLDLSTFDFVTDATIGSQLATVNTQKIAHWGATPIVQPNVLTAADATALDGTIATNDTVTDNIRVRVNELEAGLDSTTGSGLFA